jgi:uncharacterized protein (TIGR03067 family)
MRHLKASVLGLAVLAGACGVADTGRQDSAPTTPAASETNSAPLDIPVIEFKGESVPSAEETLPSGESKTEAIQRVLEDLEGTWVAVDIQHDGAKENPPGGLRWVFRDDRYEVWIAGKKLETWTFKLDPSRRPGTLEARLVGNSPGRRLTGIYELADDTLKLCYDLTGKGHPLTFSAPKGSRRITYVFERD